MPRTSVSAFQRYDPPRDSEGASADRPSLCGCPRRGSGEARPRAEQGPAGETAALAPSLTAPSPLHHPHLTFTLLPATSTLLASGVVQLFWNILPYQSEAKVQNPSVVLGTEGPAGTSAEASVTGPRGRGGGATGAPSPAPGPKRVPPLSPASEGALVWVVSVSSSPLSQLPFSFAPFATLSNPDPRNRALPLRPGDARLTSVTARPAPS